MQDPSHDGCFLVWRIIPFRPLHPLPSQDRSHHGKAARSALKRKTTTRPTKAPRKGRKKTKIKFADRDEDEGADGGHEEDEEEVGPLSVLDFSFLPAPG